VDVLSVKSILQELDDIVADGVFGREPLGPGEESALIQGGLLDRETAGRASALACNPKRPSQSRHSPEGETKVNGFALIDFSTNVGQERVDRVGNVVWTSVEQVESVARDSAIRTGSDLPNKVRASPVLSSSETLYLRCLTLNLWLPSSLISQTRLRRKRERSK
jgi:hypothetical protein